MADGDKYIRRYTEASLITTTTGSGQVIITVPFPTHFRGVCWVRTYGLYTAGYQYKFWWGIAGVRNTAGTVTVDGVTDILAPLEVGTVIGAAETLFDGSGSNAVLSVTPANTSSTRWCAFVDIDGTIEAW